MNKIKVIKDYKGLVVGDILTYNADHGLYTLTKEHSDISDQETTTKVERYEIGEYTVSRLNKYFIEIDKDDNEIKVNRIYLDDEVKNMKEEVVVNSATEDKLNKTVSELKESLEEHKKTILLQRAQIQMLKQDLIGYISPRCVYWPF